MRGDPRVAISRCWPAEGTVRSGAYQRAIARLEPNAQVQAQACSLFVALAEGGWTDGAIAEAIAHRYVDELFRDDPRIDTLLLGCTHFPVLAVGVARGHRAVDHYRRFGGDDGAGGAGGTHRPGIVEYSRSDASRPFCKATDSPERFARVGSRFLGESFDASRVELVDLVPTALAGKGKHKSFDAAIGLRREVGSSS